MKKIVAYLLTFIILSSFFVSCGNDGNSNRVVIYSSAEDFRNEHIASRLNEEFPDYEIVLEYIPTGNNAAKLKAEGPNTECDIVLGLESNYMEQLKDNFADLSSYDISVYLDDLVPASGKYMTWERYSGCIAINPQLLAERGLSMPNSYEDLLNPEYAGQIVMPNPKSSGTGFLFLRNLVNTMGEDEAFSYFDKFAENVQQFTSSGSGPVNALLQNEAAIGLGMTFQTVTEINNGVDLEVHYFAEGAPYTTTGYAVIEGKQDNKAVKDVFDFIYSTLIYEDKELFSPEQIFKEQINTIPNYPQDIHYADMTGNDDEAEKTRLLERWKY